MSEMGFYVSLFVGLFFAMPTAANVARGHAVSWVNFAVIAASIVGVAYFLRN